MPGARNRWPVSGDINDTARPLAWEGSCPTTTVANPVAMPTLLLAVSVNVRVPVRFTVRDVVPVTSPMPLSRRKVAALVTAQFRLTAPFDGNVAWLAANERIWGSD